MIGQGSPNSSPTRSLAARRAILCARSAQRRLQGCRALLLCLALILVGTFSMPALAEGPPLRLRMEWGGGTEQQWRGSASVSEGTISDQMPLGVEADEPGSMWIAGDALEIRPPSARSYDGVDFAVTAPLSSNLNVNLSSRQDAPGTTVSVPLTRVAHETFTVPLDASGNRLLIRRAPGDQLRVKFARDSVVFSVGEVVEVEVQPQLLPAGSGNRVLLAAQLLPARGGREPLWSGERELALSPDGTATEPAIFAVKMPEAEGVYELRLMVHRRALQNRLGWKQTVDERKVQVVVIGSTRPSTGGGVPLPTVAETLFEIDPASPSWWEKWASVPMMPGLRRGPLGNGDAKSWQHALGPLVQIGPGGREPNVSWEAFPLPIARPGQPHVVEVEYPTDVPQTLGVSVVEPNATGKATPIGIDSGVCITDDSISAQPAIAKHRVTFWPRTKTPLLLITNQRDGAKAVFGKVRVIGPKAATVTNLGRDANRPAFLPPAFAEPPAGGRLLAGYYDRPLFPENFSAEEAFDPWSGRGLDDWVTFYQGATRLVEYLEHVGYNGAIITVLADGSTIYPSRLLEPTPRYDTGVYFATGQDPYRKDVLELLFRLFDRAGLQLIPALQFSAPLVELENLKRQGQGASGIEPVDAQGRAWLAVQDARKGLAPYYNPLSAHTQDAMLAVARELCERYHQHASFTGLSLQLSADGYAQLPGADWGYDEQTVERFVREDGIHALEQETSAERVKLITTDYRAQWIAWRCQALSQLHRRIHSELARAKHADAKLYLLAAHLFERPEIQHTLRPSLRAKPNAEAVMLSLGIDPKLYQASDDIILSRPNWIEPLRSLGEQGANLELNLSTELDREMRNNVAASALLFHREQQLRVPSFDVATPFKGSQTVLIGQPLPAGTQNRRRFAHAIATLDAASLLDGGWMLPLGEEESLENLIAVYRELPAVPFETLADSPQPVAIRRHTSPDATYVYLVNDSPWPARVTIDVVAPPNCRLESFGRTRRLPAPVPSGAAQTWTIDLEPFELMGGRFAAADVTLQNPRITFNEDVENNLYVRNRELGERVAALQQVSSNLLVNPGFEQGAEATTPLPGWELRARTGGTADFDVQQQYAGAQSLHFTSAENGASLVSTPLVPLGSGHLSVLVWLRTSDEAKQPPLRLAVSGRWRGQDYYRYAAVGRQTPQAIGSQWTQYLFQVRDVPTDQLTDFRVRFDLMGPGEVWLDEVELREFDDDEILKLKKMVTVAGYSLEKRQLGDCWQLLEGYWPHFLVANVRLNPAAIAQRPRFVPKRAEEAPVATDEEAKPGLMDRMRRALPTFWR